MLYRFSKNNVSTTGFFLIALFFLCACSSPRVASENEVSYQFEKSTIDLTTKLGDLPQVTVKGYGRLAIVTLGSGCKPTFLLNGQIERNYAHIYDMVENSTLKNLRVLNPSDAVMFGLRQGNTSLIVIETE